MEYTEEEKKAIEDLNEILTHKNDVDIAYGYNIERPYPIGREKIAQLEIIKNLIKKQQNEIERLYKDNYRLDRENQKLFEDTIENYISKEAIREKIENITKNVIQNAGENWEKDVYSAKAIVNALNNLLKE